jgi:hypothetical protein
MMDFSATVVERSVLAPEKWWLFIGLVYDTMAGSRSLDSERNVNSVMLLSLNVLILTN